jgi:hypothetical protein
MLVLISWCHSSWCGSPPNPHILTWVTVGRYSHLSLKGYLRHTCHRYQCQVSLVIKCILGSLLGTDFNQVCGGGEIKKWFQGLRQLLLSQPKTKKSIRPPHAYFHRRYHSEKTPFLLPFFCPFSCAQKALAGCREKLAANKKMLGVLSHSSNAVVDGWAISAAACHAGGPGSIPGPGQT